MKRENDQKWMRLALQEARKGLGKTSPNPAVGAVLIRGGRLLAKGFHRRAGLPHAEIEAMAKIRDLKGATLYVTLEPCCHTEKRTPPCTEAILKSGIREVVIGALDPNPKVSGKGKRLLRRKGVRIRSGILEAECRSLNRYYNHWMTTRRPYVILKSAASLDGKVALSDGQSRWISSEASRKWVHKMRGEVDGILVGIGTVLADDPLLTARAQAGQRQPARVVLDPHLKIPLRARILKSPLSVPVWIFAFRRYQGSKKSVLLTRAGARVVFLPKGDRGPFPLNSLLNILGRGGLQSLWVEGGPGVWTEFFKKRAFQEWQLFLSPKLLGAESRDLIGKLGLSKIPARNPLRIAGAERIGEDLLLRLFPEAP